MGSCFGVQGLGTEPIRSIRDVDNARTSEEYRPTEDPVTARRIPVDLEERRNHLLSNKQYGFLSGRSTTIQLIQVMEDWTKYLDQGNAVLAVDVVYMDFVKAFDKVPHNHLIEKLKCLGVNTQTVNWIQDFLTGRTQVVKYHNNISSDNYTS